MACGRLRAAVDARAGARKHRGDGADQRALVEMAQQWWDPSRVKLFEDLGLSGTSTANRPSYLDMLEEIGAGELGAVFAQDVSRLTRNPRDGEEFLEAATEAGIVLYADGQFLDLANADDDAVDRLRTHLYAPIPKTDW
jgi:DNA invertase Pin-like site-specific DNA recombinase